MRLSPFWYAACAVLAWPLLVLFLLFLLVFSPTFPFWAYHHRRKEIEEDKHL